jgi:hypothetical protein
MPQENKHAFRVIWAKELGMTLISYEWHVEGKYDKGQKCFFWQWNKVLRELG